MSDSTRASLNPEDFSIDDVLDLPLEGVVSKFIETERHRSPDADDLSQRPVSIHYRSLPAGLAQVFSEVSGESGVSQMLLSRCAGHYVVAWLGSLVDTQLLLTRYRDVSRLSDGHPDIWQRFSADGFRFKNTAGVPVASGHSSWHTVSWIKSKLEDYADPLGVSPAKLFAAGVAQLVTTNESGWSSGSIKRFLLDEVDSFRDYLRERAIMLKAYQEILEYRRKGHRE